MLAKLHSIQYLTRVACAIVALVAGTLLALKFLPAPFVWILLTLGTILCRVGFVYRNATAGVIAFNFGIVAVAVSGIEASFEIARWASPVREETFELGYHVPDPYLGSRPMPDVVETATLQIDQELLYKVRYTIGANGLRLSPLDHGDNIVGCVFFFGGSFVYGEGVADDQTLPYRTGVRSDGNYRVYNFGFHGHGPHQMLAAMEHGLVDAAIDCAPSHIVYLAIVDHISRAAGLGKWSSFGPRYVIGDDGSLQFSGLYGNDEPTPTPLAREIVWQARKSRIVSFVLDRNSYPGDSEVELFAAIVAQARKYAESAYSVSEFHVLLWDWPDRCSQQNEPCAAMTEWLQAAGIDVHPVTKIIPDFATAPDDFVLSPHDKHANARAYALLADYVVNKILGTSIVPEE
ncbi:MAG: hypothetical protein OEM99_11850 [Gammaproteobacteria bacterium]|nr:hypothetical protein [Gammaproteobacteria bacterium]